MARQPPSKGEVKNNLELAQAVRWARLHPACAYVAASSCSKNLIYAARLWPRLLMKPVRNTALPKRHLPCVPRDVAARANGNLQDQGDWIMEQVHSSSSKAEGAAVPSGKQNHPHTTR
jgi:hypothetical protein